MRLCPRRCGERDNIPVLLSLSFVAFQKACDGKKCPNSERLSGHCGIAFEVNWPFAEVRLARLCCRGGGLAEFGHFLPARWDRVSKAAA